MAAELGRGTPAARTSEPPRHDDVDETDAGRRLKSCCARFYETPMLRSLLGGALHPGGLKSTEQLGRWIGLRPGERVLDVACGPGRAAEHFARTFGCRVTGVDYSARTANDARLRSGGVIQAVAADAESLPFGDGSFDAVVMECSLCLVPRKAAAAAAMRRVLRPGGRVGVADLALERPLPDEIPDLGAWVTCLGGAQPVDTYRLLLSDAGFGDVATLDATWALTEAVDQAARLVALAGMAEKLGALAGLPFTAAQMRGWVEAARRWVAAGWAKYVFVSGRRL